MQISRRFRKMLPLYRLFGGEGEHLDYSEEAARRQYIYESTGQNPTSLNPQGNGQVNGYTVGKHWMDATVAQWKKDIQFGLIAVRDLYADPEFQEYHWWLNKIFPFMKQVA